MASEHIQHNLKKLVDTDMMSPIDAATIAQVLSAPPFTTIPGIINIRDISALTPHMRKGLIYRSGALHNTPEASQLKLKDELGIKLILDLRTSREIARSPNPVIEGIKNANFDSLRAPTPINMDSFVEEGGKKGYVSMYEEVLEIHEPSIRAALEWVRDEGTPMLFHCTAGKDRTGVLAAILLSLTDTPKETIAYDYALTRIGIEPARELLLQMLKMWNKEWTEETPGIKDFSQVKAEFMMGTLDMVEKKFGGAEGYVKGLGFGEEDVAKIKKVLRGE